MDTPTTAALLAELESLLIDAGETCPSDYQSGFDWDRYNQMIAAVKQLFREHCSGGHMTKDDAIRLVRAYADIVPPDDHIRMLPDRMADHSLGEVMRLLGYVQGVLVERGVFAVSHRLRSSGPSSKHTVRTRTRRKHSSDI